MFSGRDNALLADAARGTAFAMDAEALPADVPAAFYGLSSYVSPAATTAPVTRKEAMSVPAIKRARDLIAGTLGTLPVDVVGPDAESVAWPVLDQPERDVPRSVTMARTFEDALFHQVAWWRVVEFGWHNYPVKVKRIDPRRVTVKEDQGEVRIDGAVVPNRELIRFDAPTDGLLIAGARAIRTLLALDSAAARASDGTPPVDYFTPADGFDDPAEDDDVEALLDAWDEARRKRSTAYVPQALKYNIAGWSPEQLQMADARQHAVLEIARLAGIDAEELGVSTTSRTYANQWDRRKSFLDFTLGAFRQAFEDRLSMGDLTPRGYAVKFNLSSFLRSDDLTRMQTYEIGHRVGAYTTPEIRDLEDKPPLDPSALPPAPTPTPEDPMNASAQHGQTFDADAPATFDSPASASFSVDTERRVIRGLAVPYGRPGTAQGVRWQFARHTLRWASDLTRIKVLIGHDFNRAVGVVFELDDRADGLYFAARIASGPAGDEALAMAAEGVWDGVSIGLGQGGKFATRSGVNHAVEAPLLELSLTPLPSFTDARVHAVAASATHTPEGEHDMKLTPEQKARLTALRGQDTLNQSEAAELSRLAGLESAEGDGAGESGAASFSAIADAIQAGFAAVTLPPREEVNAAGGQFQVDEAPMYRFDGLSGQRSLTGDMRDALHGDAESRKRLDEFFNETFAVDTTDTASLNPTQNRPDLYVGALHYNRPLWDLVTNGSIDDRTPFTIPKFVSASDLVNPHVEGVEPEPGTFVATSQTVTPGAVSGKIEVNREVLDQGGSPQADQIIWNEMVAAYYEAIEVKIAALLAGVATPEVNLDNAVDSALVGAVKSYLAGLQFVRGGNRFTALALDGALFPALIEANDDMGRSLLPVLSPSNADGSTTGAFDRVSVGGLTGRAAWALGTGDAARSYNFVPSSVYAWASTPKKFEFQYQVKSVDIGIWGYSAEAVTREADVKPIDYSTLDA